MELRRYLIVLRRNWFLALPAFIVTTLVTLLLVVPAPQVYEASATFVVGPGEADAGDELRAIDTLIRGVEINETYAAIARSGLIRDRAKARIDPEIRTDGISISPQVITSTNVLQITATGPDAAAVHAMAAAIGQETVDYVDELDEVYRLTPLDEASPPSSPTGPNKPMNIAIGVVLAALLALGLAMLREYLWGSEAAVGPLPVGSTALNSIDAPSLTLGSRLAQAVAEGQEFSLALVHVTRSPDGSGQVTTPPSEVLSRLRRAWAPMLRRSDRISLIGRESIAIFLPGMPLRETRRLLEKLTQVALAVEMPERTDRLRTTTAACEYVDGNLHGDAGAIRTFGLLTDDQAPDPLAGHDPAPTPSAARRPARTGEAP